MKQSEVQIVRPGAKFRTFVQSNKTKIVTGAGLALAAVSNHALADASAAETMITGIKTDATAVVTAIVALVVVSVGLAVVFFARNKTKQGLK